MAGRRRKDVDPQALLQDVHGKRHLTTSPEAQSESPQSELPLEIPEIVNVYITTENHHV